MFSSFLALVISLLNIVRYEYCFESFEKIFSLRAGIRIVQISKKFVVQFFEYCSEYLEHVYLTSLLFFLRRY